MADTDGLKLIGLALAIVTFAVVTATAAVVGNGSVFLDATKTRTGFALTRADAVLNAEFAIEKTLESRCPKQ